MADERDLELLDDYLAHRMGEQDRSAFERKLQADPDIQHEYALQQRLIKGIKDARIAELKSMLNQVPVPANNTGSALASKIIFGAVVTIMVAATAWYFTRNELEPVQENTSRQQVVPQEPGKPETEPVIEKESAEVESALAEKRIVESDKNQTSAGTEHSKPSLAKKPDPVQAPEPSRVKEQIDVFNPTDESSTDAASKNESEPVYNRGASSLLVETDRENGNYTFHYQFKEGKLLLYGPFEKNLYEIMEFFTDEKRTVFLYYKDHYYLLNEADANIRSLQPINDPALIRKLKEYRLK